MNKTNTVIFLILFPICILGLLFFLFFGQKLSSFSFYDVDGNNYLFPDKKKKSILVFYNPNCLPNTILTNHLDLTEDLQNYYFIDWGSFRYEYFYKFFLQQNLKYPFVYDFNQELRDKFSITKDLEIVLISPSGEWEKISPKDIGAQVCSKFLASSLREISFSKDIRPIFEKNCVHCHNQNHAYLNFLDPNAIHAHSRTIAKVIHGFQMPPWTGHNEKSHFFENSMYLNMRDRLRILNWVNDGAKIDQDDQLSAPRIATKEAGQWSIGEVDYIFQTEKVTLPAHFQTGGIYKVLIVDPQFKQDVWVKSLEVAPKNKSVVHHILVHLAQPGQSADEAIMKDFVGSYLPGQNPFQLNEGYGKKISKGSRFVLVVHYTPTGKEEVDQISLGIQKAKNTQGIRDTFAKQIYREDFVIPPQARFKHFVAESTLDIDIELLKICPHGHFRAKAFELEYKLPTENNFKSLLFVPDFKYQWQFIYNLAQPLDLPKGTQLRCKASYDNSSLNRANPNPNVEVSYGLYSEDEMMACYIYYSKK